MLNRTRSKGSLNAANVAIGAKRTTRKWCTAVVSGECIAPQIENTINQYGNLLPCPDYTVIMDQHPSTRSRFNPVSCEKYDPCVFCIPYSYGEGSFNISTEHQMVTRSFDAATVKWLDTSRSYAGTPSGMPVIDWNSLVNDVGSSLDGHMQTKSNILVTVAEIGSTIGMIKHPFEFLSPLKSSRSISNVLRSVANGHLTYKYGWKQLRNDIVSFGDMHNAVSNHLAYLGDNSGKFRPLSASQIDVVQLPAFSGTVLVSNANTELSLSDYSARRTARFSCVSALDTVITRQLRMQAYLQALGVTKIVEAVWDLVPFSFCVDWIANWNAFKQDPRHAFASHNVSRLGHSVKMEYTATPSSVLQVGPNDGIPGDLQTWRGQPHVFYKRFDRTPGFPASTQQTTVFNTLSITNLMDSAALVLQRL